MPDKTLSEVFGDIANAIREKTESQETMTPLEMADEISSILKPSGTITISESGSYNVAEYAEANVEVAGFEPENSGWYYYDASSKWYDQPSIPANTLVYATERGDECIYPEIEVNSAYVYKGQASFASAASEGYLIPTGSTTITINGSYNIAALATVDVQVDSSVSGTKEVYLHDEEGLDQSIDVANYSDIYLKYSNYQDFEEGYWYYAGRHYYGDPLRFDAYDSFTSGNGLYYFGGGSERREVSLESDKTYIYRGMDTFIESPSIEADALYTYGQYGAINVNSFDHDVAFVIEYGGSVGDNVGELDLTGLAIGESRVLTVSGWDHKYQITRLPDE